MNENIKLYDLKEVASILKINLRVLRRYIKENKIKASKIGRKYVITAEDLEAFIKGNSKSITNNDASVEAITSEDKALLEALLVKEENNITIDLNEYIKITENKNKTEEDLEASLDELLSLQAITETELRGILITSKNNIINSYKKVNGNYEVELNKDLVKLFKENMLINTKIVRK